ncbi:MAG: dihydrofolate reductase family protein [Gammaproteobacteria bacterium]
MATVTLYLSISLDGFIARSDGNTDWLSLVESPDEDYGYAEFFSSVDALVMGEGTYEQMAALPKWPYPRRPCYVFARSELKPRSKNVHFVEGEPASVVADIKAQGAQRIWLVGGAFLAATFMRAGMIDEYVLSVVPTLLGERQPGPCRPLV